MMLGLGIVGGVVVLLAIVFTIVFGLVGRAQRAQVAEHRAVLDREGIVRDSGMRRATVRYRRYRGPGYSASTSIQTAARALVLTKESFAILGFRMERCPLAEVSRYQVSVDGDVLRLVTDRPVDATGHMDIRVRLDDAAAWARALRDAGAGEADAA